jgi:hypothetical protein
MHATRDGKNSSLIRLSLGVCCLSLAFLASLLPKKCARTRTAARHALHPARRSQFTFMPVIVGESLAVYGGSFTFFYALHTIPCVGFTATCNGKSMVYSADTFNDPDGIRGMQWSDGTTQHSTAQHSTAQ